MVVSVTGVQDWDYRRLLESLVRRGLLSYHQESFFVREGFLPRKHVNSTHEEASRLVLVCSLSPYGSGRGTFSDDNGLLGLSVETEESVKPFVQSYVRYLLTACVLRGRV